MKEWNQELIMMGNYSFLCLKAQSYLMANNVWISVINLIENVRLLNSSHF